MVWATIMKCCVGYLHDSWPALRMYRRAFHTRTIVVAWNICKHVIATLSTCPGRDSCLLIQEGQLSQLDLQFFTLSTSYGYPVRINIKITQKTEKIIAGQRSISRGGSISPLRNKRPALQLAPIPLFLLLFLPLHALFSSPGL